MSKTIIAAKTVAIKILAVLTILPAVGLIACFKLPIAHTANVVLFKAVPLLALVWWPAFVARAATEHATQRLGFIAAAVSCALLTVLTLTQYLGLENCSAFKIADPEIRDVLVFALSTLFMILGFLRAPEAPLVDCSRSPRSLKALALIALIGWTPMSWSQSPNDVTRGLAFRYNCITVSDNEQLKKIVLGSFNFEVPGWFEKKFPIAQTSCTLIAHHINGTNGGSGFCFSIVQVSVYNRVTGASAAPFTWRELHNTEPYPSCVDATMGDHVAMQTLSEARKQ